MKIPLLGTGLSGLVGSRIVELLSSEYEFEDLSLDTGVDITDRSQLQQKIGKSQAEWIIHLAAKADVEGCEADKLFGKDGAAWKINVEGTRNIVEAASETQKRVLYISTDFVFDGSQDSYIETDIPNPINWYARTKHEGESIVLSHKENIVARIAYPYRAKCRTKKDFVHTLLAKLQVGQVMTVLSDHVFTPTFVDDIAKAIHVLMQTQSCGIYHVVGTESLTPYHAALELVRIFHLPKNLVQSTTIEKYYKNRAPRPYKLALKNDKITRLGVKMHTFSDGLYEIQKQGVE